jgi:TRAP-type C4-dicarboxylate transport system substrate-binding protein
MYKGFGAAPTTINFNEVYSALQSKIVDAQENPLAIIETAKLYEVQSFCSLTNHMWDGFWLLANKANWDALPKDIQAIVAKHLNAAGIAERADVAALTVNLQTELSAKGMKFNTVDAALFRDKLKNAGFYKEWEAKFGKEAWATLEAAVGSLS